MRARRVTAVLAALLVLAVPAAAGATPGPIPADYTPSFVRADRWLHSAGSPVGNVDARDGKFVGWDGTTPTAAAPSVYLAQNLQAIVGPQHDPQHHLTMKGQAVGDLENLAFDLYFTGWAQSTGFCPLSLSFELVIDGVPILWQDYTGSDGIIVSNVDETTSVARFALTNLWQASKDYNLAYGADVVHDVKVNVQNFYVCNELTWLYDSVEQPSAVTVNYPQPLTGGYAEINVLDPPPPPAE